MLTQNLPTAVSENLPTISKNMMIISDNLPTHVWQAVDIFMTDLLKYT